LEDIYEYPYGNFLEKKKKERKMKNSEILRRGF
jgi:hypothetical protein